MSRQIVLDTETTGLSAEGGDRIIEIGCVELVARKLTGNNKHFYLNPERDSHEDALRVHGISNEFLKDKPKFAAVADELLLNKELELVGRPAFRSFVDSITDTLAMAKELYPGKRNSLDALCDRLGVDNSSRTLHGALLDAELLADVYINLTRGQDALLIIDDAQEGGGCADFVPIDLRSFTLAVIQASEQEAQAHSEVLTQIDKASGGKTIWRSAQTV